MRIDEAFDILGIEITKDKKKIKATFAKKVRECHPEEDEAGWKNLYDAYGTAMNYAKNGAVYAQPLQQEEKTQQEINTQQERNAQPKMEPEIQKLTDEELDYQKMMGK